MLSDDEYLQELIRKLHEECTELREASAENQLEELADVAEVVLALANHIATPEQLEATRIQKAQKRGAFANKIFLERTE